MAFGSTSAQLAMRRFNVNKALSYITACLLALNAILLIIDLQHHAQNRKAILLLEDDVLKLSKKIDDWQGI